MSDPQVEKEAGPTPPAAETPSSQPEKKKREYKDFGEEDEKPTRTCSNAFPLSCSPHPDSVSKKTPRSTCLR